MRRAEDPLGMAVRELEQVFAGRELRIDRVDVDASGFLQLTAQTDAGERWFTSDDRGLVEHRPLEDSRIPLARRLAESGDAGWRIVSYRPGRRMVVESDWKGLPAVLKGYRRRKSTKAALNHRVVENAMEHGAFRVPRLLHHEPELELLVFERLDGDPFLVTESSAESCFHIGNRLAAFQASPQAADLRAFEVEDELAVLETWRRKVLTGLGELPEGWSEIRAMLDHSASSLPEPDHGLCHRDLHDGQFLIIEERPALLDFDLLCQADTALDPANLLAHFRLRSLQGFRGADEGAVRACGEALLDGLDRQRDDTFWNRLRFYEATSFLRLALVYRLRPRWSKLSGALVVLARRCLEDQLRIG